MNLKSAKPCIYMNLTNATPVYIYEPYQSNTLYIYMNLTSAASCIYMNLTNEHPVYMNLTNATPCIYI